MADKNLLEFVDMKFDQITTEYSKDELGIPEIERVREQIKSRIAREVPIVYKVQHYLVKFDMANPVDVNISVYHENKTELSREEILAEAFGYAEEVGITVDESCLFEIETLEMR